MRFTGFGLLGLIVASCASLPRTPEDYPVGYRERGFASWYGEPFHGRKTASGEVFDMNGLTAAHRLLPLGTVVKVTNRENGRSVAVKVNDRGPFVRGRHLDLSYEAARRLDMVGSGVAPVTIEVVSRFDRGAGGPDPSSFTVQVGAFENKENARRLVAALSRKYPDVYLASVAMREGTIYRVRVGALRREGQAARLADRLAREDNLETFVTRKDP